MRPSPLPPRRPINQIGHDACGTGFLADQTGRPRTDILPLALTALGRMDHRGGLGADGETGDGAGILTAIPWAVLIAEPGNDIHTHMADGGFGLASVFMAADRHGALLAIEQGLRNAGLNAVAWREVPTNDAVLGRLGRASRPGLTHVVIARPHDLTDDAFEHQLFVGRREIDAVARECSIEDLYIASMSHRSVVYKALLRGPQLREFYTDLRHPEYRTPFAVFHNRYSTNTQPSWARTQPFRQVAHNGEINTIDGNRRWMEARGMQSAGQALGLSAAAARPLLAENESDSGSLDEAFRLLLEAGHSPFEALGMLMPPAWENDGRLPLKTRAFYEGASRMMEPWDGPALIAFSDGRVTGAILDRNGLRPARSTTTVDGLVLVASEAGVLDVPESQILDRGRLGPGGFLAVDMERGVIVDRALLDQTLSESPITREARGRMIEPGELRAAPEHQAMTLRDLSAFGYSREELQFVIGPMARDGVEPVGSMGDDTPLALLSERPRLLSSFFKQRFAQVTNPPIDPLREHLVMSLRTSLGPARNPFQRTTAATEALTSPSPVLSESDIQSITNHEDEGTSSISLLFNAKGGVPDQEMERALDRVLLAAVRDVRDGATRLVLSDRGVDARHAAIPALLAASAVHQRLIREGLRLRTSLILETGEPRDDHQIAALISFGANAVCPYGAFEAARYWAREMDQASSPDAAVRNVARTLEKGLLKILSKMGIATVRSYHGAQLFEILGLDRSLVDRHFTGTASQLEGHGPAEIARDVLDRHARAYDDAFTDLEEGGAHRYRRKGELHAFEPPVIKALHTLIKTGDRLDAVRYSKLIEERAPLAVRDLLRFRASSSAPMPIESVEATTSIFKRFSTAAMSLGSLSPEAHTALAIAMNRIGGLSNSGEGGEPEENYWRDLPGGDSPNHRIKQVASARFGVTTDYLVSADELQIKIAQGSKPGEGGQLPGRKVVAHIARVRHSPEGVTLISPPPHHDIYSIEDLAQLIHDLKRVNPRAIISVKLVSSAGIGTIAAGVAKAGADTIAIGGHDGGTGASPLSSIKNAGTPWELGLLEVQETLLSQGLRNRVRLRVEGGFKTGRDVVMAAAMGADEFAFGTAALVATGCVMARQCHLNTCPAGIATQREELRRHFKGTPEQAVRYFAAVAEEVREILASLGRTELEEVVGDLSLLEARKLPSGSRASRASAEPLLRRPATFMALPGRTIGGRNPFEASTGPDEAVLSRLEFVHGHVKPLSISRPITAADRSVGARVAGEVTRHLRGRRLSEGTLKLHFRGSAGQSFGAFAVTGMTLSLEGEANDYVGKGLSGGEISIRPRLHANTKGSDQVIAGNTLLYGATRGRAFIAGQVGERFGVRLSGAVAVVEGTGDHACEYMTAGTVAILGPVGRNLGAGMSGGLIYVYDPGHRLIGNVNEDMVAIENILTAEDEAWVKEACERHVRATSSPLASSLLKGWPKALRCFKRVKPRGLENVRPVAWTPLPAVATTADLTSSVSVANVA
ncbi:MAG: glutamate synthase large subunit [Vicinamibacteria bacterium]